MAYLDDWIFGAPTLEEVLRLRERIERDMVKLGWVRQEEKGNWELSQKVEYLGVVIDIVRERWFVPVEKVKELCVLAIPILEGKKVSFQKIARVVGKLVSMSCTLPLAKLYVRETFQEFLEEGLYASRDWSKKIRLQGEALEDLGFCVRLLEQATRAHMWRPARIVAVYADATLAGWGGYICGRNPAGRDFGVREAQLPIHMKEALAVWKTLRSYEQELRGKNIVIFTDNKWVFYYLRDLGGNGRG